MQKLNSNILILDEILDEGIDSVAIKNIINILKRKSTETNQSIFIISHRSEISEDNIFDHVIEVVKEKGISNLSLRAQIIAVTGIEATITRFKDIGDGLSFLEEVFCNTSF